MVTVWWLFMLALCQAVVGQAPILINETQALLFEPPPTHIHEDKLEYLRIMHIDTEHHFMLIGSREFLYNVSMLTMMATQEPIKWSPSEEEILFCRGDAVKYGLDCDSYVRAVLKRSDDMYHICASSSKKPSCRALSYSQGDWTLGSKNVDLTGRVPPIFPWSEFQILTAENGAMYLVGDYFEDGSVWVPQLFRDNIYDDAGGVLVSGLRTPKSDALFKVDNQAQRAPEYTSIFETDNYVFFTYSEPALETSKVPSGLTKTYSRIARVCKNDAGKGILPGDGDARWQFATLFKARIVCGNAALLADDNSQYLREKYNGYYSTTVDEIAHSTTAHISSMVGANGEKIVMAIFNNPWNEQNVSAICAYKVSEMDQVFNTSDVVTFNDDLNPLRLKTSRPAAKCYEEDEPLVTEAVGKFLLYDKIMPMNGVPLFMESVDYRMTQIQVDWQVRALDGQMYDVIFVSTDDGRLLKLVKFSTSNTNSTYHLIESRNVFGGDHSAIREMEFIHDNESKKHLLLNNLNKIKRVSIEKCHRYTDCASCIGLRDPYCSWSPSLSSCVSTTHEATDKYQNITHGVSSQCVIPVKSTTKSVVQTTSTPAKDIIAEKPDTGASRTGKDSKDTAYITALIIVPIVVGGLAFLAGFYYSKRRFTSPTPHIDHELTNKSKEDMMNCDAYQTLPKQSNLQLMNNLNGKLPNVETTSIGERTLTRQKQVYV